LSTKLFIALEPSNGGAPVVLAQVQSRGALLCAARAAIGEARDKTRAMRLEDPTLGLLQAEESARLERALTVVIPELAAGAVQ
jgi:hypothetical protein